MYFVLQREETIGGRFLKTVIRTCLGVLYRIILLKIHADKIRYHVESIKHLLYEFRVVSPGLGPFLGPRPFYIQKAVLGDTVDLRTC